MLKEGEREGRAKAGVRVGGRVGAEGWGQKGRGRRVGAEGGALDLGQFNEANLFLRVRQFDLGQKIHGLSLASGPAVGLSVKAQLVRAPKNRGAQNFALFFSVSRHNFHFFSLSLWGCSRVFFSLRVSSRLFSSLWRSSRGILVVFWSVGTSNVLVSAFRLSCGSPRRPAEREKQTQQTHTAQGSRGRGGLPEGGPTHAKHTTTHTTTPSVVLSRIPSFILSRCVFL